MIDPTAWVSELAVIDTGVTIGANCRVWEFSKIREGAVIGAGTTIGMGAYIGPGVSVGKNCKIQNNALIYDPAILGDGVFIGPAAVLTNDKRPEATGSNGEPKLLAEWNQDRVVVGDGASLGAGSICVAPVRIGMNALVGAGAVVTRDVQDGTTVVGVPANPI